MSTVSHADLISMVRDATEEVFSTMLNIAIECNEAYLDCPAKTPSNGVISFIGLAGPWAGMGSISCTAQCACSLSGQLTMTNYDAIDDEVLDAVAELTNMILGNVKTKLEDRLGPMGLSIPTVIYGRNFSSRTLGKKEWTIVPFICDGERFDVQLCLAPQRESSRPRLAFAGIGTVEV